MKVSLVAKWKRMKIEKGEKKKTVKKKQTTLEHSSSRPVGSLIWNFVCRFKPYWSHFILFWQENQSKFPQFT